MGKIQDKSQRYRLIHSVHLILTMLRPEASANNLIFARAVMLSIYSPMKHSKLNVLAHIKFLVIFVKIYRS